MVMDKQGQSTKLEELAGKFLEQFLVRDAHGEIIDVKCTHQEFMYLLRGKSVPTLPGISAPEELTNDTFGGAEFYGSRAYSATVVDRRLAKKNFESRWACLSPIDQLKFDALDSEQNPAEAIVVAKMYLEGAFETQKDFALARELLTSVADAWGDPIAADLLSANYWEKTPPYKKTHLIEDEILRGIYRDQAYSSSRVFRQRTEEWSQNAADALHESDEFDSEFSQQYLEIELQEIFPETREGKRIGCLLDLAEAISDNKRVMETPQDYLKVALYLQQLFESMISAISLINRYVDEDERYKNIRDYARTCLQLAAPHLPVAYTELAKHHAADSEEKYAWLFSAAYPETGDEPDMEARYLLARDFYLDRASPRYDFEKGEACLANYIKSEYFLEDGDAACMYADILYARENRSSEDLAHAFALFKSAGRAYPAFAAAMMALRGEGIAANIDLAKSLLEKAVKVRALSPEEKVAVTLARIALILGWGSPEDFFTKGEFLLIPLISQKLHWPDNHLIFLTGKDVIILIDQNKVWLSPEFILRRMTILKASAMAMIECSRALVQGHSIFEGNFFATVEEFWPDDDPFKSYLYGHLCLSGKVCEFNPFDAGKHFRAAAIKAEELLNIYGGFPNPIDGKALKLLISNSKNGEVDAERMGAYIQIEKAKVEAAETAKKELLSFLSHTLTNSLCGTSDMLLSIARSLSETETRTPSRFRRSPAERLVGLVASMSLTERLVENFKLYASDPDAIRTAWAHDSQTGEISVRDVAALALRQGLLRFLFATAHGADFGRLLPGMDRIAFVQKFLDEAMSIDIDTDSKSFLLWTENNIACLNLEFTGAPTLKISRSGPRFIVLFSILCELFGNALKYSDGREPIHLKIDETAHGVQVLCSNTCDSGSTSSIRGGRKGISFMRSICSLIGASLELTSTEQTHVALARLPIE